MRIEQLRLLCEIIDAGFNLSRAAQALHTSQPGASKQMQLLERELGFEILRRHKGRVVGLTEPGAAVAASARKIVREAANVSRVRDEFGQSGRGEMVIATTHLHARYVLPPIVARFRRRYPLVRFSLLQANPAETAALVTSARADIGITGERFERVEELVQLPCYAIRRSLIAPRGHPIFRERPLTLEKIAAYPQIAYDNAYPGGLAVRRAFERAGLSPDIIISAIDSEVIKAYVEIGVGLAVVPSVAHNRRADPSVAAVDVTDLFGQSQASISLHVEAYMRDYMYEFIQMVAPEWTRARIAAAIAQQAGENAGARRPRKGEARP